MQQATYIHDRRTLDQAGDLLDAHGSKAHKEARARANASRDRGNIINFCRWRQIERLIVALDGPNEAETRH